MITLEEAKKIDPELKGLSDEEITVLLRDMYETANLGFDIWWTRKNGSKYPIGLFPKETEKDKIDL